MMARRATHVARGPPGDRRRAAGLERTRSSQAPTHPAGSDDHHQENPRPWTHAPPLARHRPDGHRRRHPIMASMVLCLASLTTTPSVSMRALHRVPQQSIASYIALPPRTVELRGIVSWPAADVQGWLLEVSVCSEAVDGGAWYDWEAAATLPGDETSHILNLQPGLGYRFRLAGLSDSEGQLPFSSPTSPILLRIRLSFLSFVRPPASCAQLSALARAIASESSHPRA